jgi:hypothetical protein
MRPARQKKAPISVPLLDDAVCANALRTTTSSSASTSGKATEVPAGRNRLHTSLELVLRIGPGESSLRLDRQPIVAETREIEWFGYAGWFAAQE